MTIRPATDADRDAIARICLLTGNAGGDATGMYGDETALADVYATPYLDGPGSFALVWDQGEGAIGYCVGTSDTAAFQAWFTRTWWPSVAHAHPLRTEADETLLRAATNAERMMTPLVEDYPAHLHIDLLPQAQGKGAGRQLIEAAVAILADRGVPGVHLGIDPANVGAAAFYPRVGFQVAPGSPGDAFVRAISPAEA
ncbi:GNAT family N-acetyltransferase [Demequina globuliformis]|uniref:GNAT family N-acetyltransferase n=1 Tax=Demequina globuliformis TaxID=676202 RepID=UPI0007842920|nr:GNAT family N-acetyltransferase [Demequina globuliformis]